MTDLGKLPPQAVDIEQLVLSAILIEQDCYWQVNTMLSKDLFYKDSHRIVFEAIESMYQHNEKVDLVTVYQKLKSIDKAISSFELSQIAGATTSTANIVYHCHILIQKATARKIIYECNRLMNDAYNDTEDIIDLVDRMGKVNEDISAGIFGMDSFVHISELVKEAMSDYQKREQATREGRPQGIPTGLSYLNRIMYGWQKADLIVLAARPGMGKTAMMLHHVITAAESEIPVCIFSLEMSGVSLSNRLIMAMAQVDMHSFKNGTLDEIDINRMSIATERLNMLPIYIDSNATVTMRYIRAKARVMKHRGQCDMVFIDYLQLCDMRTEEKGRNREQEVSATSRMAKIIAKELDIPVVLLSQLNRGVEGRADKRPGLADLRESGAIEQDADIVVFLYRDEYYQTDAIAREEARKKGGEYIIAKHRNGATCSIAWSYNDTMTRITDFVNYTQIEPTKPYHEKQDDPF